MLSVEPFDVPLWNDFERFMEDLERIGRRDLAQRIMDHQADIRQFERRMWWVIELFESLTLDLDASEWERLEHLGTRDQSPDEPPQRSRGGGCADLDPDPSPACRPSAHLVEVEAVTRA